MSLPDEPLTRKEQYLSNIAGQGGDLPEEPLTRVEQYLDYIARNGGTGGGSVDITIDSAPTQGSTNAVSSGGVYAALREVDGVSVSVTVDGTEPVVTALPNSRYICGELSSLTFTPCSSGLCEVVFSSGTTPTVLNLPQTVVLPEWFEVEANRTYEISILDGVYGAVMVW